jgi:hypothetical protein
MSTVDIELLLNHEITWRTSEISIVKAVPFLFPFSHEQRSTLKKHTIPIFYSLWEGFVVEAFGIYAREINSLQLNKDQICLQLLTHSVDSKYKLRQGRTEFSNQIRFVQEVIQHFSDQIEIPVEVPTESNVNWKVINSILTRFNLKQLPEHPHKKSLDRLLFFRNKLSHGENSIPIDQPLIDEMSNVVISSMHEVTDKIIDGFYTRSYLR